MNTIYCFSATGNSLAAAKEIAKNIDAQVLPMNDASCIPTDASVIGFVFPVYALFLWVFRRVPKKTVL